MPDTTCKDCLQPVYWVPAQNRWYHVELIDVLLCPALSVETAEV